MNKLQQSQQFDANIGKKMFLYPPPHNGRYIFCFEVKDVRKFEIDAQYAEAIGIIREKKHGEILWIPSKDLEIIGWKFIT